MPTRFNTNKASPIMMLTEHSPCLVNTIVFGSPRETCRDLQKNSLMQISEQGIIFGKITTRHVRRLDKLTDEANGQLQVELQNGAAFESEELAHTRQADRVGMEHTGESRQVQIANLRGKLFLLVSKKPIVHLVGMTRTF
uniref:AlNc14C61G4458 protein n=1 Tax=Albugo laibachii Nc14 TaxID=890382 RepID=F0WCT2_9STRA|nr:AlNc14C61G4458 [Albugo laibachii Nc14]|eukprot:CCA19001.1 AlNc14C61G4458 [Albugo laibachii Nc14]